MADDFDTDHHFDIDGNFDTNLMALHTQPFAAYIEPGGYDKIKARASMKDQHYKRFVPITHNMGHALYGALTQVDCWGKQLYKKKDEDGNKDQESGGWVQETRRLPAKRKDGGERPGRALDVSDLLKSLSRPAYYAIGRTDKHLETGDGRFGPIRFPITQVACLCGDVDMDDAWETGDVGAVRHEVWREFQVAAAMGLPYRAFVTGGRGHQFVLPLPVAVDRSVASWLLTAFEGVLRPWHERDGGAVADVSNLEKLVRVAGGRHIRTGRLALWIDPVAGRLYDLPVQAELMATGYRSPESDPLRRALFAEATEEIAAYLASQHSVRRHECLPPMAADTLVTRTLLDLPDNPLVESVRDAQELYGLSNHGLYGFTDDGPTPSAKSELVGKAELPAASAEMDELSALTPDALLAWAERVWAMNWGEGTYWDWIAENGHRGITAAKILYGPKALEELLARAKKAAHTTPGEPREWERSIRALYAKHRMQSFESADALRLAHGSLSDDGQALVPLIVEALHAKNRILPRNRADAERLVQLLLVAFQDSKTGYVDLSLDTLHAALKIGRPEWAMSRSGVQRHLLRLRDDKPECGYALLDEIVLDRSGQNMATRYRPGPALRATAFGASLPTDECEDHVPLDAPIRTRVRTLGGLQWREKTPKPRGRKPSAAQTGQGEQKRQ